MADPDADSDDEFENSPDYYSILNVRKDVSYYYTYYPALPDWKIVAQLGMNKSDF